MTNIPADAYNAEGVSLKALALDGIRFNSGDGSITHELRFHGPVDAATGKHRGPVFTIKGQLTIHPGFTLDEAVDAFRSALSVYMPATSQVAA